MMSIFGKIKLALFSSGFILTSYDVYAMQEGDEERLPKGLPVIEASRDASSSSQSFSMRQDTLMNELLQRIATLNKNVGEDTLNDSEEVIASPLSSLPALEKGHISKKDLEDISARLSPLCALLNMLESKIQTKDKKKRGSTRLEEKRGTTEISIPNTNVTMESTSDYEENFPRRLRDINKRLRVVTSMNCKKSPFSEEEKQAFPQLLQSLDDVVKIYKRSYPDFQLVPEDKQREHMKRRATMGTLPRFHQVGSGALSSSEVGGSPFSLRQSEGILSVSPPEIKGSLSSSSLLRVLPESSPKSPPLPLQRDNMSSTSSRPLSPVSDSSLSLSLSQEELSFSFPGSPPFLRREINGSLTSPRPLPSIHSVPSSESVKLSSSPDFSSCPAASPPLSPSSKERRQAFYLERPPDLSGQRD